MPGVKLGLDALGYEDDSDMERFSKALANFMELQPEDLKAITPYLYEEFKALEEMGALSEMELEIDEPEKVWEHLQFTDVDLMKGGIDHEEVIVLLAAECSWDEEHGIQVLFHEGNKLCRVSEQDGHYDYKLSEEGEYIICW